MAEIKTCPKCSESKSVPDGFYRDRHAHDGLSSRCRQCVRARVAEARLRDVESYRARERSRKPPGSQVGRHLQRKYGIDAAEYQRIVARQGGGCAICGGPEPISGRSLAVDHDHTTGAVRGVLCSSCNRAIGLLGDDAARVAAAAAYLESA